MITRFDHLVIGAANLDQGANYVRETLGVNIPRGGVHEKLGTHNLLMRLSETTFFEVIAISPDIPAPSRPRWFGLDDPEVRRALQHSPALLTWVANTTDINACLAATPIDLGQPDIISRDHLSWTFGLPEDGRLFEMGLLPCLIEWHSRPHPAAAMADLGCRLQELTLYHPNPNWLASILETIKLSGQVTLASLPDQHRSPLLEARLETPTGIKILRSPAAENLI